MAHQSTIRRRARNARYAEALAATKALTLDERILVLDTIIGELNIDPTNIAKADSGRIDTTLRDRGLLPMMFNHAARVILSRHRLKRQATQP